MQSNSSTKSNLSKNASLGTLILKKDQIRLNKADNNTSSNNTNTFRHLGSVHNSELKVDGYDSSSAFNHHN